MNEEFSKMHGNYREAYFNSYLFLLYKENALFANKFVHNFYLSYSTACLKDFTNRRAQVKILVQHYGNNPLKMNNDAKHLLSFFSCLMIFFSKSN